MTTSEDHFDSLDSESPNTTPRGEKKRGFQGKLPGLVGRPSPFYLNSKKEYAQLTAGGNTGRSMNSSHQEVSEIRRLYERSGTIDGKKDDFDLDLSPQWSATHRQNSQKEQTDEKEEKKEKEDFTFQDKDEEAEDAKKEVALEMEKKKALKEKKAKKGKKKDKLGEEGENQPQEKPKKPKKIKKKEFDSPGLTPLKGNEDIGDIGSSEAGSTEGDRKLTEKKVPKKRKSTKSKTASKEGSSEDDRKSDHSDSSQSHKKKNKELNFRQLMAIKQHNLSISEHNPLAHDPNGFIMTENISFVNSPQSLLALTKAESCSSPAGTITHLMTPREKQDKPKKKDKKDKKDKKEKKDKEDKKKKYEVVDEKKPKKDKTKKHKDREPLGQHDHHQKSEIKRILLSDGLNLVKLITDRTNCKKTKLIIILYTFTVLWSIVLNALEFSFFLETTCKPFTENGTAFFCFTIMVLLKFFSVSLFNLEITFKQPYKSSIGLLYPLFVQCFCPLLQLPQNVYDFSACLEANQVVKVTDTWKFLRAIIGSIIAICLYIFIKRKVDYAILKSRVGEIVNRIVKFFIILLGLAWNFVLIIVFCAQKEVFLPSLFFDFYIYLVLAVSVCVLLGMKKKRGLEGLKAVFVKDEKKLSEPLSPATPVRAIIKIEVQP